MYFVEAKNIKNVVFKTRIKVNFIKLGQQQSYTKTHCTANERLFSPHYDNWSTPEGEYS